MIKKLQYLFFPHHSNNHKAKALHLSSLTFLLVLIAAFQVGLSFLANIKPGVLGFAANINPNRLVDLTNQRRSDQGLGTLQINGLLSEAARRKASEMFTFGCWSHDCNGHSPWWFISGVGYSYIYAGENLAKDFADSDSVVNAWMNSPSHRDNILNGNYKEIGIAVVDGVLNGEETTLVVQMFGSSAVKPAVIPEQAVAEPKVAVAPAVEKPVIKEEAVKETVLKEETVETDELGSQTNEEVKPEAVVAQPMISGFKLTKIFYIFILSLMIILLMLDSLVIYKNKIIRVSGKSFVHASFFIIILLSILLSVSGKIL